MFLQARMLLGQTALSPFGEESEMAPLLFRWLNFPEVYRFMGDIDQFPSTKMMLKWAFEECNLKNVHLSVSGANTPAISLYEKIGFQRCGCYQDSRYEEGKVHNEILMEFLKDRYNKV